MRRYGPGISWRQRLCIWTALLALIGLGLLGLVAPQSAGAHFYGSTASLRLNAPVVGMAVTQDNKGYWVVAKDGGVFTFGDARFYGSTGNLHLNQPVDGIAVAPGGHGYRLVASDGGVFTFTADGFFGSLGNVHLNKPIVGMSSTPNGMGYTLVGPMVVCSASGMRPSMVRSVAIHRRARLSISRPHRPTTAITSLAATAPYTRSDREQGTSEGCNLRTAG